MQKETQNIRCLKNGCKGKPIEKTFTSKIIVIVKSEKKLVLK